MKKLIDLLGWIPFVGENLKFIYILQLAKDLVAGVKVDNEKANLQGQELEDFISEKATQLYEEHLQPEVDKLNLPEIIKEKASEKAIEKISTLLRDKYQNKIS